MLIHKELKKKTAKISSKTWHFAWTLYQMKE